MKIAIITDLHFGRNLDEPFMLDYFEKFYSEVFFPYLKKNNIKNILCLGDLVERRKFINSYTFHRMNEMFLKVIESENYSMHILKGNHDTYYKNTSEVNFIDNILHNYKNIHVVPETLEVQFDDCTFLLCNWIDENNKERIMNTIAESSANYLCGHFELNGFNTGVITMTTGMDTTGLEKFNAVFSGHFHLRQIKDNIHYVGCPYEMDFFDTTQDKGFFVFDTKTKNYEIILNPHKIFVKFIYDDRSKTKLSEIIKDFSIFNKKYVELIVKNKDNVELYEKFKNKFLESNPSKYRITDNIELSKYILSDDDVQQSLNMSNKEIIINYINNIDFSKKSQLEEYFFKKLSEAELNVENSES